MSKNTCCFFGHRKIEITNKLTQNLSNTLQRLIANENVDTFLFGSRSQFDDLCHQIVSKLKAHYPHIKRIYVRAEYPYISDDYKSYLLESYEDTYYPHNMLKAGKSSYVERNRNMIDKSNFCVVYFDENYLPPKRRSKNIDGIEYQPKSGTKIAFDYAVKKQKAIINMFMPKH